MVQRQGVVEVLKGWHGTWPTWLLGSGAGWKCFLKTHIKYNWIPGIIIAYLGNWITVKEGSFGRTSDHTEIGCFVHLFCTCCIFTQVLLMRNRWSVFSWEGVRWAPGSTLGQQLWWRWRPVAKNHWLRTDAERIFVSGEAWGIDCYRKGKKPHAQHRSSIKWEHSEEEISACHPILSGGHQKSTQDVTTKRRLNLCSFVGDE